MPLTRKGRKILHAMQREYGPVKGRTVFYASRNKGVIRDVEVGYPGGPTRAAGRIRGTPRQHKARS